MRADFHIHTRFSDGDLTPFEILKLAEMSNVDIISITDHGNVEGVKDALRQKTKVMIIPGIELSTTYKEIHILGYFKREHIIDIELSLQKLSKNYFVFLKGLIKFFRKENDNYLKILNKSRYKDIEYYMNKKYMGNESAQELMNIQHLYNLTPEDCIHIIRLSGGIPVLAHPLRPKLSSIALDKLLFRLVQSGLKGIECFYPDTEPSDIEFLTDLAIKYNLLKTVGSDFHREPDKYISKISNLLMSLELIEELKKRGGL